MPLSLPHSGRSDLVAFHFAAAAAGVAVVVSILSLHDDAVDCYCGDLIAAADAGSFDAMDCRCDSATAMKVDSGAVRLLAVVAEIGSKRDEKIC